MSDALILHHYETSPFSEKVRVAFGIKGAAWRSVLVPNIMPKPDLLPLTGGYRRTPVMQIGADVFCDTQVILAELDRRAPRPALVRGGLDWAVNLWADRPFFQATVPIIFGQLGDRVPGAFVKDREQLSGRPFDLAVMAAAGPLLKPQWRAQAAWLEQSLRDPASSEKLMQGGVDWLAGDRPGLADAAAYMNIWFLERNLPETATALLVGFPRLQLWKARVAALGHGAREELSGSDALDIAAAAEPVGTETHDLRDPLDAAVGDAVAVSADDYGRDRVEGRLVAANPERIVIERSDSRVGRIHVHFPRVGYHAAKA